MSRIGNQPVLIPSGVDVSFQGLKITIKGSKGELSFTLPSSITVEKKEEGLIISRADSTPATRSLHGLVRALLANMVTGVSKGFEKRLEIIGVGYRAAVAGKKLTLNLGFSHPVDLEIPAGISVQMDTEKKNVLIISGIDRQRVGQFSANIRSFRPPEPYKGKGIRYEGERVIRKAGKTASKGEK